MAKFKTNNGCHVRFLVNENDNDVVYPAFEDRYKGDKIIDMESPDFFSRFKVTLGPLLPIEYTKKGIIKKYETVAKFEADYIKGKKRYNFIDTINNKGENSNDIVRGKIRDHLSKNEFINAA